VEKKDHPTIQSNFIITKEKWLTGTNSLDGLGEKQMTHERICEFATTMDLLEYQYLFIMRGIVVKVKA
jgi:hypothetical protein